MRPLDRDRVIRGLRPDSNAARAGLREGDEVIERTLPDQEDPNRELTFTVRRGIEQAIRFTPEGRSAKAHRWTRVPGVPDSSCRY